MEMSQILKIP